MKVAEEGRTVEQERRREVVRVVVAEAIHDLTTGLSHKTGSRARRGDPDCRVIADILLRRLHEAGIRVE